MAYTEHQWNRLVSSKEDKGLGTVATTRDRRNTRTQFLSEEWRRKSSPNNSSSEFLEYLEQHVRFQIWANGNHLARYPHHHRVTHRSKTILPWRLWQSGRPLRISTKPNSPSSQQILLSIMWALPEIRERAKWNCLHGAVDVQVLILLPSKQGYRFVDYAGCCTFQRSANGSGSTSTCKSLSLAVLSFLEAVWV